MDVLVAGGTGFIGRHVVAAGLAAGWRVSVLARGAGRAGWPPAVEVLQGDRDDDSSRDALAGRGFAACVDCSGYTPAQVGRLLDGLAPGLQRHVFLSAAMVYGDAQDPPVREAHPRVAAAAPGVDAVDGSSYGPLKVACEDLLQRRLGRRSTLLRPQVVVGPHDRSGRLAYWQCRAGRGGRVLAPGDGSDWLQFIDVRDLADFVVRLVQADLQGAFNLAGPRLRWADFLALLGVTDPQWVPAARLQAAGLGFRELPLYRPAGGLHSALMHVSSEKAQAAGLRLRPVADTLRDAQAAMPPLDGMAWLDAAREAALIAAAAAAGGGSSRGQEWPIG